MAGRVDRYILSEVLPQFFLWLCVLSGVLVVSQLVRLTDVLSNFGFSAENFLLPFIFIILPFLSFTIPMSFLFAVMVGFSRLSADGEYTALLANGVSLRRMARPVFILGILLYLVSAFCALRLEPWGRRELMNFYQRKARTELDNLVRFRLQSGVFVDDFLGFVLYAEKVSKDRQKLTNVLMAPGEKKSISAQFTLMAPSGSVQGSVENRNLVMGFDFGTIVSQAENGDSSVIKFRRAEIDMLGLFEDQIIGPSDTKSDYRNLDPGALFEAVDKMRTSPEGEQNNLYNKMRFLAHQRGANALCIMFFAMVAIALGVQDPRRGKSGSWSWGILALVLTYVLSVLFKWAAENGYLNVPFCAWGPNIMLMVAGSFLVYQKNRLPISESPLAYRSMPWVGRHSAKSR